MLKLNVNNETSRLLTVVLGTAKSNGSTPKLEECYDPKSRQNVLNNTYPTEIDMINEMNQFEHCLLYTSPSPRDYAASRMPSSA